MTTAIIAVLSFLLGWCFHTVWIRLSMYTYMKKNPAVEQFVKGYHKQRDK